MKVQDRFQVIKGLKDVFKFERYLYALTNVIAFLLLAFCCISIIRREVNMATLSTLFGSSGLVSYSSLKVLKMWDDSLKAIFDEVKHE